LEVTIEQVGKVTIVGLPGEYLDAGNSKEFKRDITPVLEAHQQVIFDMSQLRFVDSSGLGAVLACMRQLHAAGGTLKLCGMMKPVRALFDLVQMHRLLEVFDTKEEALRAFQA
jgi:anti-sigma B factor antagonist